MKLSTAPRSTFHAPGAFTLIEIMIVAGIAALVMATAIPFLWSTLRKDPLRQAVSDIVEACSHARARAIFSGVPSELRILPQQHSLQVTAGSETADEQQPLSDSSAAEARPVVPPQSANFSMKFSEELHIEELAVNFLPFKDADEARVRFYSNGTSDEFTIVLQWPAKQQWRKISLDVVTGLADVQVLDGRIWK